MVCLSRLELRFRFLLMFTFEILYCTDVKFRVDTIVTYHSMSVGVSHR